MVKSNNYEPRANNTFVLSPTKFRFKLAEDMNQRLKTLIYRAGIRLFAWCLKLPPQIFMASREFRNTRNFEVVKHRPDSNYF